MSKVKLVLKEFLFIPCLLLVLTLLFSRQKVMDFYENSLSAFSGAKLIFISVLTLIALESFLMFDVPKNLLFSRTISCIVMIGLFILFTQFLNALSFYLLIISFIVGGIINYLLQRFVKFKGSNFLSIAFLLVMVVATITLTYWKIF